MCNWLPYFQGLAAGLGDYSTFWPRGRQARSARRPRGPNVKIYWGTQSKTVFKICEGI